MSRQWRAGLFHSLAVVSTISRVSGNITLQGLVSGAPARTVTFTPTSGSPFTQTVSIGANGIYSFAGIPAGSYSVRLTSVKYLASTVNVTVLPGETTTLNATLKAGDANNDNAADIRDLLLLIAHYNQVAPSNDYSEACDFNSDDRNDIADLLLIIANYNQIGN